MLIPIIILTRSLFISTQYSPTEKRMLTDTDNDGVSDYDEIQLGADPIVPVTDGYPFWMLAAIIGGVGFIGGIVIPPVLRFTFGKIRGDGKKKPKKKSAKKTTSSKKTSKKEGGKK